MMDTATLQAIEKGAIALATTEAYADRIRVPRILSTEGSAEQRVAGLREAVLREAATFGETLPSLRMSDVELASYRAKMGGDAALESALDGLLRYKEDLTTFVDFLFVLRAEVYAKLADRAPLTQADVDDTVFDLLTARASKYGYAGIRKITDRDLQEVFIESVRQGELQYDYFFRGQLFEVVVAPGHKSTGTFLMCSSGSISPGG